MSSPSPKSPELSDRSKKYDRQLRLWGEHGQSLLERSNICLINATAVGCEVIKGLVLPGIGSFTIIDGSIITEEDLGTNFFLESKSIGASKAECCMRLLQELNPDASGDFLDDSIDSLLETRAEFFKTFDVVIASNLAESTLLKLSNLLWDYNIPLIYCRSVGFVGSIRLQIKEHFVIEAHPDNRQFDLRLEHPFKTLKDHLDASDVTSKVPWVVVVYKNLLKWSESHEGKFPKTFKEKNELRDIIRNSMKSEEENHEEAIKAVNTVFGAGNVTSNLNDIFNDEEMHNIQSKPQNKNTIFWIILKAIQAFVKHENDNMLPLSGVLPDMTADTESYIRLQNIYREKALEDSEVIYRKCLDILDDMNMKKDLIPEALVRRYCREASGITFIRGTKIADEYIDGNQNVVLAESMESQQPLIEFYVGLRAFERFYTECGYIPGDAYPETDTARLTGMASKILTECGIRMNISDDLIYEICRYGGAEIHSISAFIGGCVAQEVIKILTQQYIPIDNTFLYNGFTTETATYKF